MPKLQVYDMNGASAGEIELSDAVFGIEPNEAVLHQFIKMQLANKRTGLASTKTRSMIKGSTKKPWRQKGTGRARSGMRNSPVWRGGGTVFGPQPRDYGFRLPRKVRRLALKSALSSKVKSNNIIVVTELAFDEPKTKKMMELLGVLNAGSKTLVVTADGSQNVYKSARNIPGIKSMRADFMSVYDILNHETLLITRDAVARVEEVLA